MKKKAFVIIMMLLSTVAFGQLKIGAELRPRLEFRDGYKSIKPEGKESILLLSQRSRLGLNYTSKLYTTHLSFQDVRVWGEEPRNVNQINLALHEAWVEFNASQNFKIKIGRQVLSYDNARLISLSNWNQIGAKHDAIKFSFKSKGWQLDFVGATNQSGNYLTKSPYLIFDKFYKNLGVVWIKKFWENFSLANLSVIEGLRKNAQSTDFYHRFTSGIIAIADIENTHVQTRFFYQDGREANGISVSAYWINLELQQKLNKQNALTGGLDLYSGNEAPNANFGDVNSFSLLYGGKHKFNGLMDYFMGPKSVQGMGLTDIYFKFITLASEKVKLSLDYHYFKTKDDFIFEDVNYDSYLGSEIDLTCTIKISPEINILNTAGIMLPSTSMTAAKGSELGNTNTGFYFVTMLTFKPVFFKN